MEAKDGKKAIGRKKEVHMKKEIYKKRNTEKEYRRRDWDCTVLKIIDFPRYNMECSGQHEILHGIFRVESRFPLHFVLYLCNLDYLLASVSGWKVSYITVQCP